MPKPIQVFGNVGSPYTQKILALLRYRNIPYTVSWGDVIHNLSLLNLEPPKPVLLPTIVFNDYEVRTDTTPIIRYLDFIFEIDFSRGATKSGSRPAINSGATSTIVTRVPNSA